MTTQVDSAPTPSMACHRHIAGEMGGTTEWYVRTPDGLLLVVGHGYLAKEKAMAIADALTKSYVEPDSPMPF
jgi:hypothetical protein